MPVENSLNPARGKSFQIEAAKLLSKHFGIDFILDHPLPIGSPAKNHRFDFASTDLNLIGESKNYSWTEGGNVPSAKMGFINEAVFYLSFLPSNKQRFIAMRKDLHVKRNETLAEYYFRTYKHLLNGIDIIEIDIETGILKKIE